MRSRMPVMLSSYSPTLHSLANVIFSDTQLFFAHCNRTLSCERSLYPGPNPTRKRNLLLSNYCRISNRSRRRGRRSRHHQITAPEAIPQASGGAPKQHGRRPKRPASRPNLPIRPVGQTAFVAVVSGQEIIRVQALLRREPNGSGMACQTRFRRGSMRLIRKTALIRQQAAPVDKTV